MPPSGIDRLRSLSPKAMSVWIIGIFYAPPVSTKRFIKPNPPNLSYAEARRAIAELRSAKFVKPIMVGDSVKGFEFVDVGVTLAQYEQGGMLNLGGYAQYEQGSLYSDHARAARALGVSSQEKLTPNTKETPKPKNAAKPPPLDIVIEAYNSQLIPHVKNPLLTKPFDRRRYDRDQLMRFGDGARLRDADEWSALFQFIIDHPDEQGPIRSETTNRITWHGPTLEWLLTKKAAYKGDRGVKLYGFQRLERKMYPADMDLFGQEEEMTPEEKQMAWIKKRNEMIKRGEA